MEDLSLMWQILKTLIAGDGVDKNTFKLIRNLLESFALYATVVVVLGILIYAIIIRNRDEENLRKSRRTIVGVVIGYSFGVISILGFLRLAYQIFSGDIDTYYWLFAGLFALLVIGIVVTLVLKNKNVKGYRWSALAFAVAFVVYSIVIISVVPARIDWGYDDEVQFAPYSTWQMVLFTFLLIAAIVAIAFFGDDNSNRDSSSVRSISYAAICIALSYALSYIKFFSLPQGGSVTFASLLPLILYSYMFGTRKGLVAGVVYGMLQFVQSPQFYEPMQVLLDYPIAFGAIGVAGISRKFKFLKGNMMAEFVVGSVIAGVLRYLSHATSGFYVFFHYLAPDSSVGAMLAYAFGYNSFVLADIALVIVVGIIALSTKTFRRTILETQATQD
ncbi:MAG: energy-coupled thiamine transporter ThiT [Clostridiales bacterium]|nr:energy-coupled thiamine transporter ThiT [Clostridiales bacterium]